MITESKFNLISELDIIKIPKSDEFPFHIFPEKIQTYIKNSKVQLRHDPNFTASAILTAYSTIIGKSLKIQTPKGWSLKPNLWMVLLGSSGTVKSPIINNAMKPIYDRHIAMIKDFKRNMSEWNLKTTLKNQALANDDNVGAVTNEPGPKPFRNKSIIKDATPESLVETLSKGDVYTLCSIQHEMNGFFGQGARYGGNVEQFVSQMINVYDGDFFDNSRKTSEDNIAVDYYVTLIGASQPEIQINKTVVDQGLMNRFLFIHQTDEKLLYTKSKNDTSWLDQYNIDMTEYMSILQNLYNKSNIDGDGVFVSEFSPDIIQYDQSAQDYWVDIMNSYVLSAYESASSTQSAYLVKLVNVTDKLALILHTIKSLDEGYKEIPPNINVQTLYDAHYLALYYNQHFDVIHYKQSRGKQEENIDKKYMATYKHIVDNIPVKKLAFQYNVTEKTIYGWINKNKDKVENIG